LQGFSRAVLQNLGKKGVASFKVNAPEKDYKVVIDKSVKKVRPYTVCAIVKGLKFDDEKIKEIVDIQEKLHMTLGRKRKKIAIGIYPLEKIKLPIRFLARKPNDIKFMPLEMNKELTGAQILRQHPTGRDYAHLLQDADVYPIFIDADNKILSMPPIINSHDTGKIGDNTKDVFIECSGFNLEYQKKVINIIVTSLADMGGKICAMEISDPEEGKFVSPDLEAEKMEFKIEDVNKMLGLELCEKEVKKYLVEMGIGFSREDNKTFALVPAYRADVLHWVDLAEDVAIAYGYDNFEPEIPAIATIAEEDRTSILKRKIGDVLAGAGLLECSSLHLCKKKDVKKMHYEMKSEDFICVEDSKTEYDVLRNDLLSNLMKIFSENSDATYPQKIFEMGRVFARGDGETGIEETEKLGVALAGESANFTDIKQILDYLFRMLDKTYSIEEVENSNFISGRVAGIKVDGVLVGVIGEIAPRVLKNWKLKMPVACFEIDISFFMGGGNG